MFFDVFMIVISAFAVFGLYSLVEMLSLYISARHSPRSVTIMLYNEDADTYGKIKFLQNNMYNNTIFLLSTDEKIHSRYYDCTLVNLCEIKVKTEKELFTKNRV